MALSKKDIIKSKIYPVLVLEAIASERNLGRLIKFLEACFLIFVIVALGTSLFITKMNVPNATVWSHLIEYKLLGILALDLAVILLVAMLRAYLRSSYYFENVLNNRYEANDLYTFTVGRILYRTLGEDWLAGFMRSDIGRLILARSGIVGPQIEEFLTDRASQPLDLALFPDRLLKLKDFVSALYKGNADFAKLLSAAGMSETDLLAVVEWVVKGIEADEISQRFWRKENLDRIGSLGKEWSYGFTPMLDQYGTELLNAREVQYSAYEVKFREKEVRQIENILARSEGSNVLLIGESGPVRMDALWSFVRELKRGTVLPQLEHKRVVLFNNALFLSSFKERSEFEKSVIDIMNEAVRAGDVILVFDDFAGFLSGAEVLQSQIFGILDPYFASSRLSVIAMSDTDKYQRILETRSEVMARFERVLVPELDILAVVDNLLVAIDRIERTSELSFSYQSLKQIVQSADAYLSEGSLTDKARDLVVELVPWALQHGIRFILPQTVSDYVGQKTNVPSGAITEHEKEILQNLEQALHGRVIGQNTAIAAVAGAMKRARAGVVNQKRPLGSFLFLGPTGVGKTETAKALSFAYFGTEDKLMRLDMTEYQDDAAVEKLIGSFKDNKPGVLSNLIRQNVFGVLLLDEFEKTNKDVLNLFLQILDEGVFSDMNGKKVNARNIIFIATSNAGAETIWRLMKEGKDPSIDKDSLINEIVQSGIYRPELLNRFDDIVVFHPLGPDELYKIAGLMLKKLAKRLEPKGIVLVVNDFLIKKVSSEGSNELFGARPMNRYIQDKVEQAIADKIIAGELGPGKSIEYVSSSTAPGQFDLIIT